jgi:hypothetical protein
MIFSPLMVKVEEVRFWPNPEMLIFLYWIIILFYPCLDWCWHLQTSLELPYLADCKQRGYECRFCHSKGLLVKSLLFYVISTFLDYSVHTLQHHMCLLASFSEFDASLTCMWLLLFLGVIKWRYKLWLQCYQELLWGFDGCWNTGSIKGDTKIIIGILKLKTSAILNCSLSIIC